MPTNNQNLGHSLFSLSLTGTHACTHTDTDWHVYLLPQCGVNMKVRPMSAFERVRDQTKLKMIMTSRVGTSTMLTFSMVFTPLTTDRPASSTATPWVSTGHELSYGKTWLVLDCS